MTIHYSHARPQAETTLGNLRRADQRGTLLTSGVGGRGAEPLLAAFKILKT